MTYEELKIGDSALYTVTVTEEMVNTFAQVSGDTNPVHLDADYAAQTRFKERIAHGALATSFISKVLGCDMPGYGTIYLSQQSSFVRPVKIGDTITVEVSVTSKQDEKKTVTFNTECKNQLGKVVVTGEAVVMPPKS